MRAPGRKDEPINETEGNAGMKKSKTDKMKEQMIDPAAAQGEISGAEADHSVVSNKEQTEVRNEPQKMDAQKYPNNENIETAAASLPAADSDGTVQDHAEENIDTVHSMIRELGVLMEAARGPKEPTEEEKKEAALAAKQARKQKARARRRKAVRSILVRLLVLVVVVYVLLFQLVGITVMPNGDMYPRIDAGDLVLYYRLEKSPKAQDIIVLEKDVRGLLAAEEDQPEEARQARFVPDSVQEAPSEEKKDESLWGNVMGWLSSAAKTLRLRRDENKQMFICRVVAVAGDTVEISDDGRLIVNGNAMIETNIFSQTTYYVGFTEYPLTLHPGECFVMADLRNGGADSRFFGPVTTEEIMGTVITIMRRNNL